MTKDQIDPPPLKGKLPIPKSVDRLIIRPGDSVVVFRSDESIEVYPYIPKQGTLKRASITAIGTYWLLENEDWRGKLDLRTADKIKEIMSGSSRHETGSSPSRRTRGRR